MPSIKSLLPAYKKAMNDKGRYKIIRLMRIDGHEVAWMEYQIIDFEGKIARVRLLECECNYTRGVGWDISDGVKVRRMSHRQGGCLHLKTAVYMRHLELFNEYAERFKHPLLSVFDPNDENISSIIMDLLDKVKNGGFVGECERSEAWDGKEFQIYHINLWTVLGILHDHCTLTDIDRIADQMVADKKILRYTMMIWPSHLPIDLS